MNAMTAIMPMHAAVAALPVKRIENVRQPVLDLLILMHDRATEENWIGLRSTAEQMAHAARILWLEQHADEAGVVRH